MKERNDTPIINLVAFRNMKKQGAISPLAPIKKLVNYILYQAVKDRASDIHIEPFEEEITVRYRIDGILKNMLSLPKKHLSAITSRIKDIAGLEIVENSLQYGRLCVKLTDKEVDIKVYVMPTIFGERIVFRLIDKGGRFLPLEDIGLSNEMYAELSNFIHKSNGMILVTGPAGSGKTTTLYSILSKIHTLDKNILTVEDPVAYQLKGIGQMQVNPKIELTFANGLRSVLRQDPDIIMIGEIRDLETARLAIQASLTRHLVFSTLYANDAVSAITSLINMGIEPFLISSSIIAIMAQRLIRLICNECKETYVPEQKILDELRIPYDRFISAGGVFYRGKGCEGCGNSGYKGRSAIYELMIIDDGIKKLLMANSDTSSIKQEAIKKGMITLLADGANKVLSGVTTAEEVLRITQE